MANQQSKQNVRTDRFGNANVLIRLKQKKDKKSGAILPIYQGYVELGNKLYKIEVSPSNKQYADGIDSRWCKVTAQVKRQGASL